MARSDLTRAMDWATIATVAIAATSAQSAALTVDEANGTEFELSSDTDCYVLIGASPTAAATTSRFLQAGRPWTLRLDKTGLKVAVIRKSADGTLTILKAQR